MTRCHVCGSATNRNGTVYRCSYCEELVCETHRLPENHSCAGSRTENESVENDGPESTDFSESNLPGSAPRRTRRRTDSGPDVDPDGSMSGNNTEETSDTDSGRTLLAKIRSLLFG